MSETVNVVRDGGRSPARPGYDHAWFPFIPILERPAVAWPNGARIAVNVVLDIGAVEWEGPGFEPSVPPPGGRGVAPYPDFPRMSHREFGHRVGVFRLLSILKELDIVPAAVIDVLTVEHYPTLLDHVLPVTGEVLAGGLSASRPITSLMSEEEERHYIGLTLDRMLRGLGIKPIGWLGPEHCESERTPGLLSEAGLSYVADWMNDEQPYPFAGALGLWSYPLSWELSDLNANQHRQVPAHIYARTLHDAFEVLREEGGRILSVYLQPWSAGQAFRAGPLRQALTLMRHCDDVWWATPQDVLNWWRTSPTSQANGGSHGE